MEDFIEIIFYIVILVLSGIGSFLKNKKKQQKTESPTPVFSDNSDASTRRAEAESSAERNVATTFDDEMENELIKMLREAEAAAEAQRREKEAWEQQQKALQEEESRRKLEEENRRKAELIRAQEAKERAKRQAESKKRESKVEEYENSSVFGLDLSDSDDVRKAFIASEIFNKKYS